MHGIGKITLDSDIHLRQNYSGDGKCGWNNTIDK